MLTLLDKFFDYIFQRQFESCMAVCSHSSWAWRFLEDISQGRV